MQQIRHPSQHHIEPLLAPDSRHPWPPGYIFQSPGSQFSYRVIGSCCRLFDREQLPWPCCRLQWRSKEPSWRRIGRRLIADLATRRYPSYAVELLGYGQAADPFVTTLYTARLSATEQDWWHSKRLENCPSESADAMAGQA